MEMLNIASKFFVFFLSRVCEMKDAHVMYLSFEQIFMVVITGIIFDSKT